MVDGHGDYDHADDGLRDAFGTQITAALNLRSRDEAPTMSPTVLHRRAHRHRARRRVLAGALTVAILAGAGALIADRTRHTVRTINPSDTTTEPTTATTEPRPALTPVTADQLLDAPIGSLCGHPAGRLQNGTLPGIASGTGFVGIGGSPYATKFAPEPSDAKNMAIGDLDGDGVADGVALVRCWVDAGNVDSQAFVWGPGPRLIGRVPFEDGGANTGNWPSSVSSVAIVDGVIHLRGVGWQEPDCHSCPSLSITRSVTMAADGTFATDHTDRLGHTITMDGVGPVHAGMPIADLASTTNSPVEVMTGDTVPYSPDLPCFYFAILGADRITGTGGNGVVGAVYVDQPAYRTEAGVGPGSTVEELQAAYPGQLSPRENLYRGYDDLYLGSTGDSGAAIRFVLDSETGTRVEEVISGHQPAVKAAEGCS